VAAQRPPGQRLPSFRPYHGRRPQLVLWLIIGLALVATSVIVFAALGAYFLFRGGKAAFSEGLVRSMPKDVWICDNYTSARSLTLQLAPGGARYQVQFECPESPAALDSDYVSELEYRGWTVRDDGTRGVTAYSYTTAEALDASFQESSPNRTSVTLDVETASKPPPDFPVVASPSSSARSR